MMAAKGAPGRLWLSGELVRLESMRLDGQSAAEIALSLGRTIGSVRQKLFSQGVRKPSRVLRWLELFRANLTDAEAARRMGTLHSAAARNARAKLRKMGFRLKARRAT